MKTRIEKDSMGEKAVPEDAYYGIHTVRSLENFSVGGEGVPLEIIYGMVQLKWACARANQALGLLPADKADAIVRSCRRVLAGEFDNQFPIDVFQAGSGTSSNMNVNEVIANLACEVLGGKRGDRSRVHPNDDVNKGQSTNNTFPSAIKIAAVSLSGNILEELKNLVAGLRAKSSEFSDVIKIGRTHLQDAVPITLGQEFGAYARALEKDVQRIEQARAKLHELGVGGNAVGTGVTTKKGFAAAILHELREITGVSFQEAENGVEATQFLTDLAGMSAMLGLVALDLQKICNDLRLLASGPNAGFNEINLPAVEPGSSIMPGKVNPSICEAANMACMQIMACDHAIHLACGAGQLELNTHMPLIGFNLVKALKIAARTCRMLAEQCIKGITANREICARNLETSAGWATVLNPRLGYDRVAELVKESLKTGKTLRELVLEKKIIGREELEQILKHSTEPAD